MKMQKGICVKTNNSRSIFLVEDGRFLEGRAAGEIEVGEEGYFFPLATANMRWAKLLAPAVVAAAALILMFSILMPSEEAYAYIQLEANPGIEIGIDEDIRVISIRHLNNDGKQLVEKLGEWDGKALDEILTRSIDLAAESAAEDVTITTVPAEAEETATSPVNQAVLAVAVAAAKNNIDIHLKKATRQQWKNAVEENVPVGQKVEAFTPVIAPVSEEGGGTLKVKSSETAEKAVNAKSQKTQVPPGQAKKAEADVKAKDKTTPPGQQKKAEANVKPDKTEPQNTKKAVPPVQVEKGQAQSNKKKTVTPVPEKKVKAVEKEKKVKSKPLPKPNPNPKPEKAKPKQEAVKPNQKAKTSPAQQSGEKQGNPEQKKKVEKPFKSNNKPAKQTSDEKKGQK